MQARAAQAEKDAQCLGKRCGLSEDMGIVKNRKTSRAGGGM